MGFKMYLLSNMVILGIQPLVFGGVSFYLFGVSQKFQEEMGMERG